MSFDEQYNKLLEFVKDKHSKQVRKYTNEPYHVHLINVSKILLDNEIDNKIVLASLCHDLFEDTDCTETELMDTLHEIGLNVADRSLIVLITKELTDKYIKESYPSLNRRERKILECYRLSNVSYMSKTIKYADLIDNSLSIIKHDKNFARVYIKEKEMLLSLMNTGDNQLYNRCLNIIKEYKLEQKRHQLEYLKNHYNDTKQ